MLNQPRVAKVLAALLLSMTAGAIVLMALGNNPPSAGPFCLSSYYRLNPLKEAIYSKVSQSPNRWDRIEVYFSGTRAGNIEQLASLAGMMSPEGINCHFVICNGLGGNDGQILTCEKWKRQWSVVPSKSWFGTDQTIRICVVADGGQSQLTDFQLKRAESLVEVLFRRFNIRPEAIYYPTDWQ